MIIKHLLTTYSFRTFYLVPVIALGFLVGCASSAKIHSLYDQDVDFAAYKTYAFADKLGTDQGDYSSLVTKYLKDSISRELTNRGYQASNEPDLIVNFFVQSEDKTKVTTTPSATIGMGYGRGYYGYRTGVYGAWPIYDYGETRISQYTQGTLNIDLVDAKQNQLVWEGIAVGRIPEDVLKDLDVRIDNVVTQIFAEYPFAAGN